MNRKKEIQRIKDEWGKVKSDNFNFDLIPRYFQNDNTRDSISEKTINDIDFDELFEFLDRTNSIIGQQFLYYKLRTIETGRNFDKQEQMVDYYTNNETGRINAQLLLSKLNKYEVYYLSSLFQDKYVQKPGWFWIIPTLSVANLLVLILTFFFSKLILLLVLMLALNLGLHYWNKNIILTYSGSISQLLLLCRVTKEFLKTHSDDKIQSCLKKIEEHKRGMSIFSIEFKAQGDLATIPWTIFEYLKVFFLVEPIIVFRVLRKLDSKRADIRNLFEYVSTIDMAISLASLQTGVPYFCKPEISVEPSLLEFEDIYHPLIYDCVANSLRVDGKSILLTGSNMSGKTTFIRTVAINVLCAQTINMCFAKKMVLSPMQIYSAIRITDDLMNDKSYYFEEVTTIKQMIDASKSDFPKLFLLDEIFKGTNTVERIAAGKAVLSYIGKGKNLVFVSTHDIELTDLLKDSYELYHFTEVVENDQIYFDYKLKKGNLSTRNAIRILELNGYPAEIIDEAREISKRSTQEG